MAGRIETYIHSDKSVPNKGGSIVRVSCKTDFAARTPEFVEFANKVAKMAFASAAQTWEILIETFPSMEDDRLSLKKSLKEDIRVDQIVILVVE